MTMGALVLYVLPLQPIANCRPSTISSCSSFGQPRRRLPYPQPLRCGKMFVPGHLIYSCLSQVHFFLRSSSLRSITERLHPLWFFVGFGEASPEAKAARNMQDFFTFVAVKVVLAQLQSYNPEAYADLMEFVDENSLNDGDEFCRGLMRRSPNHKALALRILEVRSAYSKKDFEWDNMKKLAFKMVDESNTKLMREYILETSHIEDE